MRDDLAESIEYKVQEFSCCSTCKHSREGSQSDYHNSGLYCLLIGAERCNQCKDTVYQDVLSLGVCKLYTPYTVST